MAMSEAHAEADNPRGKRRTSLALESVPVAAGLILLLFVVLTALEPRSS